jgi:hypothetical protein
LAQLRVSAAVRDAEVPDLEQVCDQLKVPFDAAIVSRKNACLSTRSLADRSANAERTPSERFKVKLIVEHLTVRARFAHVDRSAVAARPVS